MKKYKYLIIGGGIAGTTAAETLRQEDALGSVAIISEESHPLYSRILLSKPNFFLEKVPFDTIWMRKLDWYLERNIDFLSGRRAQELNVAEQTITLDDGNKIGYEKLLLATGCAVRRLRVPGIDKKGVNYVKTIEDAKEIIANVKSAKQAIVVGSGFISFEMLDMLHLAGLEVVSVIREKYFWEPLLDEPAGRIIERQLAEVGIKIYHESEIAEVLGTEKVTGVKLKNSEQLNCQVIILGIGTLLENNWLKDAGVEVRCGIVTDEYLATNQTNIWAAGDAAEFQDVILNSHRMCGLWINAQLQGRTAALNMLGKREVYRHLSSYTVHGFGLNIGFIGQVWRGDDCIIISRGDSIAGFYTGLIVRAGRQVIGGFMVNTTKDMATIGCLIESKIDISNLKEKLSDPAVELTSLISDTI
jgi:3-phenylpropionate/trans-cinnamate dioxygenase ferredoxin reductase subunit